MIISNLSKYIAQNRIGTTKNQNISRIFYQSKLWFYIQRRTISQFLPLDDGHVFKIYVYMCKHCMASSGRFSTAISEIKISLNYARYSVYVKRSLDWLEQRYYIERKNTNKQQMYRARILVAPDYLDLTDTYYSLKDMVRNMDVLKRHNFGYIMLPSDLFDKQKLAYYPKPNMWGVRALKFLMLLYSHNWLECYGGVDPRVVRIDEASSEIHLHDALSFELGIPPAEMYDLLKRFIIKNLMVPVRCIYRMEDQHWVFVGDEGKCSGNHLGSSFKKMTILRPRYLIEHQFQAALNRTGGALIDG